MLHSEFITYNVWRILGLRSRSAVRALGNYRLAYDEDLSDLYAEADHPEVITTLHNRGACVGAMAELRAGQGDHFELAERVTQYRDYMLWAWDELPHDLLEEVGLLEACWKAVQE